MQDISTNCLTCLGLDQNLIALKKIHRSSWDDLLHTSQTGCRNCTLIQKCVARIREELETGLRLDRRIYLSGTTGGFLSLVIDGLYFEIYRHVGRYRCKQHIAAKV